MVREDKAMMGTFLAILGVLVGIAVVIFMIAHALMDSRADDASAIAERIQPVGQVTVGEPPAPSAPDTTADAGAEDVPTDPRMAMGKQIYEGVCAACHTSGVAGAPKLGDQAAWDERLSKGIEQVYAVAIAGKGGMPPKGGRVDLSDEDFKTAVDYVSGQFKQGEAAVPEAAQESESASSVDAAASPSVQAGEVATGADEGSASEDAMSAAPQGDTAGAANTGLPSFDEADLAAGKSIYDGLCFTCHASGIAGAPKLGDKAAWDERLQKGIDQVYAVAIAGKGGMPPKGGRVDLADEEFKHAVNYMIHSAQ